MRFFFAGLCIALSVACLLGGVTVSVRLFNATVLDLVSDQFFAVASSQVLVDDVLTLAPKISAVYFSLGVGAGVLLVSLTGALFFYVLMLNVLARRSIDRRNVSSLILWCLCVSGILLLPFFLSFFVGKGILPVFVFWCLIVFAVFVLPVFAASRLLSVRLRRAWAGLLHVTPLWVFSFFGVLLVGVLIRVFELPSLFTLGFFLCWSVWCHSYYVEVLLCARR